MQPALRLMKTPTARDITEIGTPAALRDQRQRTANNYYAEQNIAPTASYRITVVIR